MVDEVGVTVISDVRGNSLSPERTAVNETIEEIDVIYSIVHDSLSSEGNGKGGEEADKANITPKSAERPAYSGDSAVSTESTAAKDDERTIVYLKVPSNVKNTIYLTFTIHCHQKVLLSRRLKLLHI